MTTFEKRFKLKSADAARAQGLQALAVYTRLRSIGLKQIRHHITGNSFPVYWTGNPGGKGRNKTQWINPGELDALLLSALNPDSAAGKALRHFVAVHGNKPAVLPTDSPQFIKTRLTRAKADIEEAKARQMRDGLLDKQSVEVTANAFANTFREAMAQFPIKAAAAIAAELRVPASAVQQALAVHMKDQLIELEDIQAEFDEREEFFTTH